jgi:hypothetical protein
LALQRVRTIPIYVPAMTNGAGFFLRLPKRPPTNTNGPALPNVKPPPISAPPPPPPFGDLSRAAQFGILGKTQMAKAPVGTGLQRHHLLEQRFIPKMGDDPRMKRITSRRKVHDMQLKRAESWPSGTLISTIQPMGSSCPLT